jgi:hypothetical protein
MRAFKCPHCAGDIKFDVTKAVMLCEHCGSEIKREEYQQYLDENQLYATNELVCPQCGAALLSYDDTIATFCCYCGSSVSFTRRITEDSKPEKIVPFRLTGEEALERYREKLRSTVFTPDWLEEGGTDRLTGVYMPYYDYDVTAKDQLSGIGQRLHGAVSGYNTSYFRCDLTADYQEVRFDAAEAFPDFLSSSIDDQAVDTGHLLSAQAVPFEPSYLAGFYADGGSVREKDYQKLLAQMVRSDLNQQKFHYTDFDLKLRPIEPKLEVHQTKLLYPVWLNTHRKGDRICYAAIDGDTGHVAAELPIDWSRFLKIALILTALFALVLNQFVTIKPLPFLCIAGVLLGFMGRLLFREARDVYLRREHLDDLGRVGPSRFFRSAKTRDRKAHLVPTAFVTFGWVLIYFGILLTAVMLLISLKSGGSGSSGFTVGILVILGGGADLFLVSILAAFLDRGRREYTGKHLPIRWIYRIPFSVLLKTLWRPPLGAGLAAAVLFSNTIHDEYYYAAGVVDLLLAVWTALDLIREHNLLSSREIPVFTMKRGGDGDA